MTDWRVIHGDCLDVLPTMEESSVDAIVTDPPYGVSVKGAVHVGVPGQGSRRVDFFQGDDDWPATLRMVLRALRECIRLLTPTGSAYVWCGHRQFGPIIRLFERHGYKTRFLIWSKLCPPPPPPNSGWPSGAELCVYAFPRGRAWNLAPKDVPRSNVIVADGFRHGNPEKCGHPTQKPAQIIRPLLAASVSPGGLVLDPFAGSGTTGIAACEEGCRFVGIEREEEYVDMARKRIAAAAAQGRLW